MVRMKKILRSVIPVCFSVMLLFSGCSGTDSTFEPPEDAESRQESDQSKENDRKKEDRELDDSFIAIQGPDTAPDGQRYDEWKGIQYTTETSFPVRTYFVVGTYYDKTASSYGIYQDPLHIEDGVLEITDAKAEPVGGEMKLRSGGYVDITIEAKWTGSMCFTSPNEIALFLIHLAWGDNDIEPFDAYTGTSLLNPMDDENKDNDAINIGEAVNTGFVESDVTWEGRTYRLFAKEDKRNASFEASSYLTGADGSIAVTEPGAVETTYTLRVPADYDGMVLAIDKDITDEKDDHINAYGDFLDNSDTYADILTNDTGKKQTPDDYYFIKVSDLLEKFGSS